jgi:hypothetical protein
MSLLIDTYTQRKLNAHSAFEGRVKIGDLLAGLETGPRDYLTFSLSETQPYRVGQISYDPVSKTHLADTGFDGVRVNIGQENHIRFYNGTGADVPAGKWINAAGLDITNKAIKGVLADNSSPLTSLSVVGMTTQFIPKNTVGLVTAFGESRDIDTTGISAPGPVYLGTLGNSTQTKPTYPNTVLFLGVSVYNHATEGIFLVNMARFVRQSASKSYSFTSSGILAGTYWKGGFYDWNAASASLTQGSTTQTYGIAGQAYAAHAGIVPSGPGSVDTGQVGLRVTGIEDSETGAQVAAQTGIITDDITTLTANVMAETSEKFSGQITFELYVVSGAPTAYSLTFNYGYSKYEDMNNRDITVTGLECVWQGNANDSAFDVELVHHKATGWTYAASGFVPGNGYIAKKSVDQALAGSVGNGYDGAWKRVNVNQFIEGGASAGVLWKIVCGQNNTIQTMDLHIIAVSEELTK